MGESVMQNRKNTILAVLLVLLSPTVFLAQTSAKKKQASPVGNTTRGRIEPLRVINGEMRGRTVTGRFKQVERERDFSFTITKADVVNGHLQLSGDFALGGTHVQASDQVTATIAGVMSKAATPWPGADNGQPKDKKKLTEEEKTEQTQSLYAQADANTGCGVMFLGLTLPQRLRGRMGRGVESLQLDVVFKPFDNERGEEINRAICRLLQIREAGEQAAGISDLNRLLISAN